MMTSVSGTATPTRIRRNGAYIFEFTRNELCDTLLEGLLLGRSGCEASRASERWGTRLTKIEREKERKR